jgi:hypothetical protein
LEQDKVDIPPGEEDPGSPTAGPQDIETESPPGSFENCSQQTPTKPVNKIFRDNFIVFKIGINCNKKSI